MNAQPKADTSWRTAARRQARRAAALAVLAFPLATGACSADALTAAAIDELDVASAEAQAQRLGVAGPADPLYVVDGVVMSGAQAHALTPDEILSIEVVKGPAAAAEWGERGAGGVIMISTRDGGVPARTPDAGERVMLRAPDGTAFSAAADPLIIIDDVVTDHAALQRLSPAAIARIEVIKGAAAAEIWGDQGARGVVRITTK